MARKIFISFESTDESKVKILKESIEKNSTEEYEAIIISDKKEPGKPLTDKVITGLKESQFFIPILTNKSINNQWVNQEIGFAKAMNDAEKITLLPIVGSDVLNDLKGFIHTQLDLSFNFTADPSSKRKENRSYKKCCEEISKYLYSLTPEKEITIKQKPVDTNKLKMLMSEIYQKYELYYTELLSPKTNNNFMRTHSHTPKGYFDYLIRESCQSYSFKYFDHRDNNRYLIVNVNNIKPEVKLELNLKSQDKAEIKLEIDKLLGNVEVKKGETADEFLQKQADYASLLAYANRKYKTFKRDDHQINKLLWQDLNKSKYKTLGDINNIVEKAKPAVDAYYKDDPSSFVSGTDFLTKSLGFVDLDFRQRHPFGTKTRYAFEKYANLIK